MEEKQKSEKNSSENLRELLVMQHISFLEGCKIEQHQFMNRSQNFSQQILIYLSICPFNRKKDMTYSCETAVACL